MQRLFMILQQYATMVNDAFVISRCVFVYDVEGGWRWVAGGRCPRCAVAGGRSMRCGAVVHVQAAGPRAASEPAESSPAEPGHFMDNNATSPTT
jgi:hypothetical protein